MNRKFEDIKVNKQKIIKKTPEVFILPKEEVFIQKDEENHNPTVTTTSYLSAQNSSKYDFLNKLNKKTASYSPKIPQTPHLKAKTRSLSRTILYLFILTLFILGLYLLSTMFLKAKVTIIPNNKTFELNHSKFTADNTSNSLISFELMIVSDSNTRNMILSESKEVSLNAKGEMVFYNEYSVNTQKIVAKTFVSDEDGKSYTTDSAVTIPGYTLDKDKKIIPGQVTVDITAFLPGEAYNGNPELFTINAFKGTDKFKKMYGKAKTSLKGGTVGNVYYLSDTEKQNLPSLDDSLKQKLKNKLTAQVPEGYILYPDSMDFSYSSVDTLLYKTPDIKFETKGELSAFLIKENDLSDSIIKKLLPNISSEERSEILPPDLSKLSFNFSNKSQVIAKDVSSFDFELTGSLALKWNPDLEGLKRLLVGQYKNQVSGIFKKDPGINSANVKIVPFWVKKLPEDVTKIRIFLK